MFDRTIKAFENLTVSVFKRFGIFDHSISGAHRTHIDARNYASFSDAVDACGPANSPKLCTLSLSNRQVISANKTIETHINIVPVMGGKIVVETGVTVTNKGTASAAPFQWIELQGTGVINFQNRFMGVAMPQWWGAKADGVTDDAAAMQAAANATVGIIPVYYPAGNYLFDASLDLSIKSIMQGAGITLTKLTRKTGASGAALTSTGNADDIILKDFELDCDSAGTDGIDLGNGTGTWGGKGYIDRVNVINCAGDEFNLTLGAFVARNQNPFPAFRVDRPSAQSITGSLTWEKLEYDTEEFDDTDDYDAAVNYRFTPSVEGKYFLSAKAMMATLTDGDGIELAIKKNGAFIAEDFQTCAATSEQQSINVDVVVEANGSSDYFEVFIRHENAAAKDVGGSALHTYFCGFLIK